MSNVKIGPDVEKMASGREFLLDGIHVIRKNVVLASAARDDSATVLRRGLVLGEVTASGKYKEYDDSDSDGTEVARCILDEEIDLKDTNGDVQDAYATAVVFGYVDNSMLFGIDANGRTDLGTTSNGCCILFEQ